ncbi:MAG: class I SAM-dependent methyltransferase [Anaerolineae bacterium]|nr:class I SAM-dependent methyltransferase [Anaerolineae bacterium]
MSQTDRERWDRRYANPFDLTKAANALLTRHVPPPGPGDRVLELACGLGRNALWLAEQGYRVDAIDISLVALRQAHAEMQRRGLSGVTFIAADLDTFPLPRCEYDLVTVFRFLNRDLFPAIRACVRPGGLVIYETLNVRRVKSRPTMRREHMLQLGELPGFFPGWTVLETSDKGNKSAFVGRKPGPTPDR